MPKGLNQLRPSSPQTCRQGSSNGVRIPKGLKQDVVQKLGPGAHASNGVRIPKGLKLGDGQVVGGAKDGQQ